MDIKSVLSKMTLEEKIALVSGTDFMYTNRIDRLGIRSLSMSDGPHGLRKLTGESVFGVDESAPATAFPTAVSYASSWNIENARLMGEAIGDECLDLGVDILLGPGTNIKKNSTCGRCFEYYSEDPVQAGKLAAEFIKGVQSRNVGTSLKHFALNNSENYRFMGDSICSERAMREIYLKPFEIAVKEAAPDTIMCAYNKVNGTYCSENKHLLTEILRDEWGYNGAVMSDWGATHDRAAGIDAGLDIEMPGDTLAGRKMIYDAIESGKLDISVLDRSVERILTLIDKYEKRERKPADYDAHHELAKRIATDSAVLLKNDGILPLKYEDSFTVVGDLFQNMRYQGAGSSMINSTRVTTPSDEFNKSGIKYEFIRGYNEDGEVCDEITPENDTVLIFAGLTDNEESEGSDRVDLSISASQLDVIDALIKSGKRCVLILFGGAAIEVPHHDELSAILYMGLPGQNGGAAVRELLFGEVNPSGRLSESWPIRYSDVPMHDTFAKAPIEIYREDIFVGYRYYTTAKKPVLYPFGYGLSYTEFEYSDMTLEITDDTAQVGVTVKNVGKFFGGEVVELYTGRVSESKIFRPLRELRAFKKIYLSPMQEERVTLTVPLSELSYYSTCEHRFILEGGIYSFEICRDAETVILRCVEEIKGERAPDSYCDRVLSVYSKADVTRVSDEVFTEMSGRKIPEQSPTLPLTLESRFSDMKKTFFGKIIHRAVMSIPKKKLKKIRKMPDSPQKKNAVKGAHFLARMLESNSLSSMSFSSGGTAQLNLVEGLMHIANGKLFRGIGRIIKPIKAPKLPKNSGK